MSAILPHETTAHAAVRARIVPLISCLHFDRTKGARL
jgi:hypothetical protein